MWHTSHSISRHASWSSVPGLLLVTRCLSVSSTTKGTWTSQITGNPALGTLLKCQHTWTFTTTPVSSHIRSSVPWYWSKQKKSDSNCCTPSFMTGRKYLQAFTKQQLLLALIKAWQSYVKQPRAPIISLSPSKSHPVVSNNSELFRNSVFIKLVVLF